MLIDQSEDSIEVLGRNPKLSQSVSIPISGFKHALGPVLSLAPVVSGSLSIVNIPDIAEQDIFSQIFMLLGGSCYFDSRRALCVKLKECQQQTIPESLTSAIHSTQYLVPTLLARQGHLRLGPFGGCKIGEGSQGTRPTEHIVSVLERFGATASTSGGTITASSARFRATRIDIKNYSSHSQVISGPYVSGATKVALLCAATADGTTEILNPYSKNDVHELISALQSGGVSVEATPNRLLVTGKRELDSFSFTCGPDVIEVATFLAASIYLNQPMVLSQLSRGMTERGLHSELTLFRQLGLRLQWLSDTELSVLPSRLYTGLDIEVTSQSIYSDTQPLFALLLLRATSKSSIRELVWKNRYGYAAELMKMGADLRCENNTLFIAPSALDSTGRIEVQALDLRACAMLLIAALDRQNSTVIHGVQHLRRGYDNLLGKLEQLGAIFTVPDTGPHHSEEH